MHSATNTIDHPFLPQSNARIDNNFWNKDYAMQHAVRHCSQGKFAPSALRRSIESRVGGDPKRVTGHSFWCRMSPVLLQIHFQIVDDPCASLLTGKTFQTVIPARA
ncbi:hypothetical protein [Herbaspirillum huttiense]|uniref:Uncharacterized protein n=2 Tax=Herbaspirillum huttiense TaxID=863372 RepID=A0AAJ2HDF4_9BURK|nr:hypothetical protein [Herbaspirillum huttiense]MDR9839339.1 hypothetical protein [Herbaspirillum huttiense]UWE15936.1 hypothetical protein NY669_23085 [Herbaspirillum huttiense]